MPAALRFSTSFDAQPGIPVPIAPGLVRLTAPNASPYTFTGTNTFLLGDERVAIVDPGPDDAQHMVALLAATAGRPLDAIVLTHTHIDHAALAPRLKAATGAPLWLGRPAAGPQVLPRQRRRLVPDREIQPGEQLLLGDVGAEVIFTPGHCADHFAFGLLGTKAALVGDHIMGWSSTLIARPDGSLADYFAALERMIAAPYERYFPAHGGPISEGPEFARGLKAHREARNTQIVEAVTAGATTLPALVAKIYPQLSGKLRWGAAMTVRAHLDYLVAAGLLTRRRTLLHSVYART